MMYGDGGWGWGAWLGMSLLMLLVIAAVVWAVVMLTRSRSAAPAPSAEDVLAGRLAAGDIESAEYEERLRALRGSAPPVSP